MYRNGREGIVVRIDRFGNIVTNLPPLNKNGYVVTIDAQERMMRHCPTYDEAPDDELFLITGSCATLEISLKGGSAKEGLDLAAGQRITIA